MILAGIALACGAYWLAHRGFAETDDAQIDGAIYPVSAQIAGRVTRVLVTDNQHVVAGQVLVVLDGRDAQAAQAQARADAAEATARVAVAQAQAAQAVAAVLQAQASRTQAAQDFARYHAIDPGATTQQQVQAATANIEGARARAQAMVASQQAAGATVAAAQAQARAAALKVQAAELQASYTVITAPASGHVSVKTIQPGTVVAPGALMLAIVGDDVWVTADYKETQLPGIRPGAAATIAVDAAPGVTFHAHVDSVQYGTGAVFSVLPAQNATGNYIKIVQRVPVKLVFDDPTLVRRYGLSPGMSVSPSITIAR